MTGTRTPFMETGGVVTVVKVPEGVMIPLATGGDTDPKPNATIETVVPDAAVTIAVLAADTL